MSAPTDSLSAQASTANDPSPRHRHDAVLSEQSGDLRQGRWGPHECPIARVPSPIVYSDPRDRSVRVVGRQEDGTCWAISLLPGQATELAIRLHEVVAQMDRVL